MIKYQGLWQNPILGWKEAELTLGTRTLVEEMPKQPRNVLNLVGERGEDRLLEERSYLAKGS